MIDYDAKYQSNKSQLGIVPKFEKYSSRNSQVIEHLTHSRSYKPSYNAVTRRVSTPNLNQGHEIKSSSLPKYMTENKSRIGLEVLNEKMLKMNKFNWVLRPLYYREFDYTGNAKQFNIFKCIDKLSKDESNIFILW